MSRRRRPMVLTDDQHNALAQAVRKGFHGFVRALANPEAAAPIDAGKAWADFHEDDVAPSQVLAILHRRDGKQVHFLGSGIVQEVTVWDGTTPPFDVRKSDAK